jgi:hypothetical protein
MFGTRDWGLGTGVFVCFTLLSCGGDWEWGGGNVGKVSCTFSPSEYYRAVKIASGNNGDYLFVLDDFHYVHFYRRDRLYECAFNLEDYYSFSGMPKDVFFAEGDFYVQDMAQLKYSNDIEVCRANDGVFAVYGNELVVGRNTGMEIWSIRPCAKKGDASMLRTLAVAATNYDYFAVEGISATPENLVMIPKNGNYIYRDPMSSTLGNEKNFCSADRLAANNSGVYLFDKTCRKIGVYNNQGIWRGTIDLNSIGISNALDIAPGEYPYIFVLHSGGVEKISTATVDY